jgi:hypothetical protein
MDDVVDEGEVVDNSQPVPARKGSWIKAKFSRDTTDHNAAAQQISSQGETAVAPIQDDRDSGVGATKEDQTSEEEDSEEETRALVHVCLPPVFIIVVCGACTHLAWPRRLLVHAMAGATPVLCSRP